MRNATEHHESRLRISFATDGLRLHYQNESQAADQAMEACAQLNGKSDRAKTNVTRSGEEQWKDEDETRKKKHKRASHRSCGLPA